MLNLPHNINKRDRMVRGILGGLLFICSLISPLLGMILAIVLIASAAISYCPFIDLIERFKLDADKPAKK